MLAVSSAQPSEQTLPERIRVGMNKSPAAFDSTSLLHFASPLSTTPTTATTTNANNGTFSSPSLNPTSILVSPSAIRPSSVKRTSTQHSSKHISIASKTQSTSCPPHPPPPSITSRAVVSSAQSSDTRSTKQEVTTDSPSRIQTPHPPGFMSFPALQSISKAPLGTSKIPLPDADGKDQATILTSDSNVADVLRAETAARLSLARRASGDPSSSPKATHKSRQSSMSTGDHESGMLSNSQSLATSGLASIGAVRGQKKKRKPSPPELLIFVRPPPSKDRNPLNLQIQLVVPTTGPPSRTSAEVPRDASSSPGPALTPSPSGPPPTTLQRRGSAGSSTSHRSEMTTASSASGSLSGGRKVTPLYNLAMHSIMPSTVSDAGTDQRVAKYGKKGTVEIDGFGVFEPRELIYGVNDIATLEGIEEPLGPKSTVEAKSEGSAISPKEESAELGLELPLQEEPPTSFEAMTPEARSPELVGAGTKLMKRFKGLHLGGGPKDSSTGGGGTASISSGTVASKSSVSAFFHGFNVPGAKSSKHTTAGEPSARPVSVAGMSLVSGLSAAAAPKNSGAKPGNEILALIPGAGLSQQGGRKSQGYVWTISKLTRNVADPDGNLPETPLDVDGQNHVLRNVWRHFNNSHKSGAGSDERHPHPQRIALRFEWTRDGKHGSLGTAKVTSRPGRPGMTSGKRLSVQSVETGVASTGVDAGQTRSTEGGGATKGDESRRLSIPSSTTRHGRPLGSRSRSHNASRCNPASPRASSDDRDRRGSNAASDQAHTDEDDDLSDPEDSEETWSCHLVFSSNTRIPIGTLFPAPHHPKVVAQLAVPFPLPDLSHTGLCADGAGLTREEIKDVICLSALHVILRESFGGLGKAKRKGERS